MGFIRKKLIEEDILKIVENKDLLKRYILLVVGLFLSAFAYNVFFLRQNLVYGGSGGIATLFQNYLDPTITILIIQGIALILGFIFLGKKKALNSVVGSILFPLFVKLTQNVDISIPKDDIMLVAICGAVLSGIASGLTAKTGFSTGGTDTFIHILVKKFKIRFGSAQLIINGIIVLFGGYYYGWRIILYALIILYIMGIITDKVVLGISENKAFYIVTTEEEKVKKYILKNLSRGVTIIDAHGGYSNEKIKMIMAVIPTSEYFKAKEGILQIDPEAFFNITDSYQVYGADAHRK
ncbi:MAG: YitT family protein [Bacilli bacterium]|nr:YitT family protein [Bacilli bacterium]MBP3635535.1 YitT family protein [Bacilli bacterium]